MKALDILEWICKESINGEFLDLIEVPNEEQQTEEWWYDTFGACPPAPIEAGTYLFYYNSQIGDGVITNEGCFSPDAEIELCNTGTMYDYDYISLYKIEKPKDDFDAMEYNQKTLKEWMEE